MVNIFKPRLLSGYDYDQLSFHIFQLHIFIPSLRILNISQYPKSLNDVSDIIMIP